MACQDEQGTKSDYVFINERGQPFGRMGIARMIERAGEAAKLPFPVTYTCSGTRRDTHGGQGNGYPTPPALPWPCQHHQHGALHGDVARAVQGHLALGEDPLRYRCISTKPPLHCCHSSQRHDGEPIWHRPEKQSLVETAGGKMIGSSACPRTVRVR